MSDRYWINKESNISRYLQVNRPDTVDPIDDSVVSGPIIREDTKDFDYLNDLSSGLIFTPVYGLSVDGLIRSDERNTVEEIKFDTSKTQYNKATVLFDNNNSVLMFDETEGYERFFLGFNGLGYINFDRNGALHIKSNGVTDISLEDRNILTDGNLRQKTSLDSFNSVAGKLAEVSGERHITTSKSFEVVSGVKYTQANHHELKINGNDIVNVDGARSVIDVMGTLVKSNTKIVLDAPQITFKGGSIIHEMSGSVDDFTNGKKSIGASLMTITGEQGVFIQSLANYTNKVIGKSVETIGGNGMSGPALDTYSKKIQVLTGNFALNTLVGNNTLTAGITFLDMGVTGTFSFGNPVMAMSLDPTTGFEFTTPVSSLKIGLTAVELDHLSSILLGGTSATEQAVLGNSFMNAFLTHIHSTGTGPSGPVQTPDSATFMSCLSTKVFLSK